MRVCIYDSVKHSKLPLLTQYTLCEYVCQWVSRRVNIVQTGGNWILFYGGTVGLKSTAESYLHLCSVVAYPRHYHNAPEASTLWASCDRSLHVLRNPEFGRWPSTKRGSRMSSKTDSDFLKFITAIRTYIFSSLDCCWLQLGNLQLWNYLFYDLVAV